MKPQEKAIRKLKLKGILEVVLTKYSKQEIEDALEDALLDLAVEKTRKKAQKMVKKNK
jgi:hypothetical protein